LEVKPTSSKMIKSNEGFGRTSAANPNLPPFRETLRDSETERRQQACDQILNQIDKESEELKKAATPERFKRYRQLISSFMKEALNQSYALDEKTRWDRSGNRKTFILVKKINASLEEVMNSLMDGEKKQIDLMAKLDEIRGMLLDLYI
jgi:uncharacterized protein